MIYAGPRPFAQLKSRHTGLLIGTTIPIANTQANRNVLLSRGYTERLSYVQRVPVPLGMWHFGDRRNGFPLMLRYPATIRIWDRRAGVLICYEQLLVWPALQTLSRNPDHAFCSLQTCTGHPARSFPLCSTSPLKTGQTFGQFLYMRQGTDEDLPRSEPIASSVSSAGTEHGRRQTALDLSSELLR